MSRSQSGRCLALFAGRLGGLVVAGLLVACGGGGDPVAPPPAVTVAVSPSTATVNAGATQDFAATIANSSNSAVTWTASGGSISGSGATVTWTAPLSGGAYTITATSVADPSKSASANVTVPPIGVSITPPTATVGAGGTQPFTAAVTNSTNAGVVWTTSGGTINGTGAAITWTAPAAGGSYTVTATSSADPTKSATATVTVTPVQIAVAPPTQTIYRGEPVTLTATVTGTAETGVTWTATCGALNGTGLTVTYTATNTPGACTVTARSALDNTKTGAATITVRPAWRVAALDDADDGACTWTHCSLREALTAANAESNTDTIRIVNTAAGTVTLASALPSVTTNVHIVGPGLSLLTINANGSVANVRRVFEFNGNIAGSLSAMTLRGGVTNAHGGAIAILGGASMTITDVRLVRNEARDSEGGGLFITGGGVHLLRRVVIDSNATVGSLQPGGGLSITAGPVVTISGGAVRHNTVNDGWGGGIRVLSASLTLDTMDVIGNKVLGGSGQGGGLLAEGATASLTLRGATVQENSALSDGGGLSVGSNIAVTIVNSTIANNTGRLGGGLVANNVPNLALTGTVIRNNVATTRGGGVFLSGNTNAAIGTSTIRGNRADETGGGGLYAQNTSIARLTTTVVDSNVANGSASATQGGGGIWAGAGTRVEVNGGSITHNVTQEGWGAAIFTVSNTVVLTDVVARNNRAGGAGGAYSFTSQANVTITGGALRDNQAVIGAGGGMIAGASTVSVTNTEFTGNRCELRGGGIQLITSGQATLTNVTVTNNECQQDGGGIGAFEAVALTMSGGVVDNNRSLLATGGGMSRNTTSPLIITGTRFSNNRAQTQGGGMQLSGTGAVTLRNVTVTGNTAVTSGGGGFTVGGNATLMENSTIAANTSSGTGGGIFTSSIATTTIRNSTISGNSGVVGGGVGATGTATLQNVTLFGNSASDFGGGIGSNNAGNVSMVNVLFSGNQRVAAPQNCATANGGALASTGGNLSDDATCAVFTQPTDKPNTPAGISVSLTNNGGPTFTHALLAGSAAINAAVAVSCPVTDQRGFTRQGVCDIGAFEFGGAASQAARSAATVRPTRGTAMRPQASTRRSGEAGPTAPPVSARMARLGGGNALSQIVK